MQTAAHLAEVALDLLSSQASEVSQNSREPSSPVKTVRVAKNLKSPLRKKKQVPTDLCTENSAWLQEAKEKSMEKTIHKLRVTNMELRKS